MHIQDLININLCFLSSACFFSPFNYCLNPPPTLTLDFPSISYPHLWDVNLLIALVAAIPFLSHVPVSIDQVPVEPEQGICVVEVSEHLLLGHVNIQVLQTQRENVFMTL